MNLPPNMGMDIDNFVGRNVNNYNDVRGHYMTSNKNTSRTVLISSSEVSVDYVTRMEQLNDISDEGETRDLIDSLQLFYVEMKEIQVNRTTDHENRTCLQ